MREKLRDYSGTRTLPVAIISAASAIPRVRELADAVVSKPFELDALLTVIRSVDAQPGTR